jgi:uncharacterized protein
VQENNFPEHLQKWTWFLFFPLDCQSSVERYIYNVVFNGCKMQIPVDWIYGLIGGLMIGAAAALYLLVNGRIMGASAILGGFVDGTGKSTWAERLSFLAALAGAPALLVLINDAPDTHATNNIWLLVLGGVLVGFGSRLGNGCTSGHGVCGMSRFSLRSIVATVVYLTAGGIALYLFRHIWGLV